MLNSTRTWTICSLIFLLQSIQLLHAQFDTIPGRFVHYAESVFNTNSVRCVTQDSSGYIYVGTDDGLFQYDGLQFKELSNSLTKGASFNRVHNIHFDAPNNRLIVHAHSDALLTYDIQSKKAHALDSIVLVNFHVSKDQKQLWYTGKYDSYWVKCWDLRSDSIIHSIHTEDFYIKSLAKDALRDSILWLGNRHLFELNIYTKERSKKIDLTNKTTYPFAVYHILALADKLYLSTLGLGLLEYIPSQESYQQYRYNVRTTRNYNAIRFSSFASDSSIYISTSDRGPGTFNTQSKKFAFYIHNSKDPASITNISARHVFLDRENNLWISMAKSLSLLTRNNNLFRNTEHNVTDIYYSREVITEELCLFRDSLILQSTEGNVGLFLYKKDGTPSPNTLRYPKNHKFNCAILRNYKDDFVLALGPSNLYAVDIDNKKVHILASNKDEYYRGETFLDMCIKEDKLYLLSSKNVKIFSILNKQIKHIETLAIEHGNKRIRIVDNTIYVLANDGLYSNKEKSTTFEIVADFSSKFFTRAISPVCMKRRGKNELVFGTNENGILILNCKNNQTQQINREQGLITNRVRWVAVDKALNIWGLSSAGLVLYNSHTKRCSHFNHLNGVSFSALHFEQINTLSDSLIGLSVDWGINLFNPLEMPLNKEAKKISITSINGLPFTSEVQFPHNIGNVELEFTNFNFGHVNKKNFEYKLNTEPWRACSFPGKLNLPALKHGDYTIEIRGTDLFGRPSQSEQYTFTIHPPWWLSWWFILSATLFSAALLYLILRYIIAKNKESQDIQSKYEQLNKELENQALRAQMNPHFLFNSLNSIRYFILNKESQKAANYLTKFSRLIRMILEHSKMERVSLQQELESIKYYVEMEQLRFENKFDFKLTIDPKIKLEQIQIPPMIIQPFIENAILHGINPKQSNGNIELIIQELDNRLHITINDDGVGRTKSKALKADVKHKSYGMNITERRLENIRETYATRLKIVDLYPLLKETGTSVTIEIRNIRS